MNAVLKVLFICLITLNQAVAEIDGKKVAFVDGVFDLAHYGHMDVAKKAQKVSAAHFGVDEEDVLVIVGVSGTDAELASYKRPSVYTIPEKMRQMSGYKGVYKVINSPMVSTLDFYRQHNIDIQVAGSDYRDSAKARKYYADAIDHNMFATFPRTEGVSTSELMRRVARRVAEVIAKNLAPENKADLACVDRFVELIDTRF